MSKSLGIDYGSKRIGISISDSSNIIANPLTTVSNHEIFDFLDGLFDKENIGTVVIGSAKNLDGKNTDSSLQIEKFVDRFVRRYPKLTIHLMDERFTSKIAVRAILDSGAKRTKRKDKFLVDKVSAAIILQDHLSYK